MIFENAKQLQIALFFTKWWLLINIILKDFFILLNKKLSWK